LNCVFIQIVKEFLFDKLHSLDLREDNIDKIGEEPHILMAMRLVGHTYMPAWDKLAIPECKAWVMMHIEALLFARRAEFESAVAGWKDKAGRRKKKQDTKHRKEMMAMAELYSALTNDSEDLLTGYKKEAEAYAQACQNYHYIEGTNAHPNVICNEKIIMKFLDYVWSPVGIRDKQNLA
jgi:hypothetical protein